MSPYELKIILNAHVSTAQPFDGNEALIYHPTMESLIVLGLFEVSKDDDPGYYVATEKLHAYAKCLCMMPLPVMNWTIPGSTFFSVAS